MGSSKIINLSDIKPLAKQIASELRGGEILALVGTLGAGKTTFTKELGRLLKVKDTITSPTFTLMHVHAARLANRKSVYLYHLDLYRTKGFKEVKALGLAEIWGRPDTVVLIEWADKIRRHWPKKIRVLRFTGNADSRLS